MARLKAARMTNATLVSTVDDNNSELEAALSNILGIPLDTEISGSIFSVVNADATVQGVLKWKGPASDAVSTIGIEVDDTNGEKFRIVNFGGNLWVLQWDTADYANSWEPIQKLNVPISSLEDLDEFFGLDLKDHDGKVLAIDATDEDNVLITTIEAVAAGSVAFPDLTDVDEDVYTNATALDLIRVNAAKNGLETISPDVAASDVEVIGDLTDVYNAAIVDADKGKVLAVGWDDLDGDKKVDMRQHIISRGSFNHIDYGALWPIDSGLYSEGSWPTILWSNPNQIDTVMGGALDGLGDARMFSAAGNSPTITLPEPGPYVITIEVTWNWWYRSVGSTEPAGRPLDQVQNYCWHRVASIDGNSVGLFSFEGPAQVNWEFVAVSGGKVDNFVPRSTADGNMNYRATGFWYALANNATIKLELQQSSGSTRYVKFASMTIAKVR